MTFSKKLLTIPVIILISQLVYSQNVGINSSGNSADASAGLEVDFTNKGFLMTRSDTADISSPAFGLMTISPGDSCLYLYNGSRWMGLGGGGCCCTTNGSATGLLGSITTLDCAGATTTGSVTAGIPAVGVSSDVDYTGGNGGTHDGQIVNSTSVTGLTATLVSGNFANGAGTVTYNISGTASSTGTANFALNIGGQNCTLSITVSSIGEVTNPTTGKTWMDRNLGASQVATSSSDALSYGDLYQWGRLADGHQITTSTTTSTLSSTDVPGHGNFISAGSLPFNWRSPTNHNLWQGVSGINNPCPSGYRLPTQTELDAERASWSSQNVSGAFNSPLKLPAAGNRNHSGTLFNTGTAGYYWGSTASTSDSRSYHLYFASSTAVVATAQRGLGMSVRCIKN